MYRQFVKNEVFTQRSIPSSNFAGRVSRYLPALEYTKGDQLPMQTRISAAEVMINVGVAWNYPQCGWMCRKQCNSDSSKTYKLMLDQVYQFTAYQNPKCYLYIGNPT